MIIDEIENKIECMKSDSSEGFLILPSVLDSPPELLTARCMERILNTTDEIPPEWGWVYFSYIAFGVTKIGYTMNWSPWNRVGSRQGYNRHLLFAIASERPIAEEARFHGMFWQLRTTGEHFNLGVSELLQILGICRDEERIFIDMFSTQNIHSRLI